MKKLFTLQKMMAVLVLLTALAITTQAQQATSATGQNFTYKIITAANHTFGYDIYNNGKLIAHQPIVPGKAGLNGYATQQEATSAAVKAVEAKNHPVLAPANPLADSPNSK